MHRDLKLCINTKCLWEGNNIQRDELKEWIDELIQLEEKPLIIVFNCERQGSNHFGFCCCCCCFFFERERHCWLRKARKFGRQVLDLRTVYEPCLSHCVWSSNDKEEELSVALDTRSRVLSFLGRMCVKIVETVVVGRNGTKVNCEKWSGLHIRRLREICAHCVWTNLLAHLYQASVFNNEEIFDFLVVWYDVRRHMESFHLCGKTWSGVKNRTLTSELKKIQVLS